MTQLFRTPALDLDDSEVINDIARIRVVLKSVLRAPRRWTGGLRRTAQARAIQGSNTIEGYTVTDADALAAVEDEEPMSADQRTWAEIVGYRRMLTYVLNVAAQPGFVIDSAALNAMHFMLLEHELTKGPGTYRAEPIYVRDDRTDQVVYEGPDASAVSRLMQALAESLRPSAPEDTLVRAAMAHLNLVMIHPYRDGNGRMARALQTMVLAQDAVLEPTFASIEEWLGQHTEDYYRVLALTGRGSWQPGNDAHHWLKFNLRAHHMQAQTQQRRFTEAGEFYERLDDLLARHRLNERVADVLFDASLGLRVTRRTYLNRAPDLDVRTASRDLQRLADVGLLETRGQTRGRFYLAGNALTAIRRDLRAGRPPLVDPYPDLPDEIRRRLAQ